MDRIPLSGDGWIELRNPEDLRDGDREDLFRGLGRIDQDRPMDFGYDILTGLKLLLIADWYIPYLSDPQALPKANPRLLRELKIGDANILEKHIEPARQLLFPKPPSPDDYEDKSSPTVPANA